MPIICSAATGKCLRLSGLSLLSRMSPMERTLTLVSVIDCFTSRVASLYQQEVE